MDITDSTHRWVEGVTMVTSLDNLDVQDYHYVVTVSEGEGPDEHTYKK